MFRTRLLPSLIAASLLSLGTAYAGVTQEQIDADAATPGDVLSAGMGPQGQRYSTLSQVNTSNVQNLVPVWSFSFGGEKQRGQESQPLIYNGKMFVTASYSRIFALDAKTGKKLWKYEHRLPEGIMPCCDVVNRGAALYDNLVIFGTLDAQLVALDQDTGKVVWKEKIDDYCGGLLLSPRRRLIAKAWSSPASPVVSSASSGAWKRATPRPASWSGRDRRSKATWATRTARKTASPAPPTQTWPGDLWKTGGAATWHGVTYDPETDLIYFGTGHPGALEQLAAPGRQSVLVVHASPSTSRPARSCGTIRTRRTTAGTSTA